ncbi:NADH-quinone oxidoreductase subunit C [Streptomyces sp. NPDC059740]|uniref:NADH-quinone oxidoreductase subunit C n=1 Tax=Streptomyces sp. NPDC059740 TaxID=3346926 RepID=UPI003665261C
MSGEQEQPSADAAKAGAGEEAAAAPVVGWLPAPADALFGAGAVAEESYALLTVDVPRENWTEALTTARDTLGCTYFDWLSAVDEPDTGFRICAHLADVSTAGGVRRLLVRTTVPHDAATLPTAVEVYPGAAWHERETHEMFGVDFTDHPYLAPLLLPEGFEGHPLRKDFVLAARVAKAWPGAKEPGESGSGGHGTKRRQMLPPGVPDPNEWGPLKGQLPPAPARPARGARAGAARAGGAGGGAEARAAGDRPVRRNRSASAGSASQRGVTGTPETTGTEGPAATTAPGATPTDRTAPPSTAAGASAAEAGVPSPAPNDAGTDARADASSRDAAQPAADGADHATDRPEDRTEDRTGDRPGDRGPDAGATAAGGAARAERPLRPGRPARPAPRSSDAPWHHARPAFDEPGERGETGATGETDGPHRDEGGAEPQAEQTPAREPVEAPEQEPERTPEPKPERESEHEPERASGPEPEQASGPEPERASGREPEQASGPEPERESGREPEQAPEPESELEPEQESDRGRGGGRGE